MLIGVELWTSGLRIHSSFSWSAATINTTFSPLSDGLNDQPDVNEPFVPFFFSQSILESRSGSRCFATFLSTQIDAVRAKNAETSSEGRTTVEVRTFPALEVNHLTWWPRNLSRLLSAVQRTWVRIPDFETVHLAKKVHILQSWALLVRFEWVALNKLKSFFALLVCGKFCFECHF